MWGDPIPALATQSARHPAVTSQTAFVTLVIQGPMGGHAPTALLVLSRALLVLLLALNAHRGSISPQTSLRPHAQLSPSVPLAFIPILPPPKLQTIPVQIAFPIQYAPATQSPLVQEPPPQSPRHAPLLI